MNSPTPKRSKQSLLLKVAESEGHGANVTAMLESFMHEASCPAICTGCGTIYSEGLEHDAEGADCEECGESKVASVMILAGVI